MQNLYDFLRPLRGRQDLIRTDTFYPISNPMSSAVSVGESDNRAANPFPLHFHPCVHCIILNLYLQVFAAPVIWTLVQWKSTSMLSKIGAPLHVFVRERKIKVRKSCLECEEWVFIQETSNTTSCEPNFYRPSTFRTDTLSIHTFAKANNQECSQRPNN